MTAGWGKEERAIPSPTCQHREVSRLAIKTSHQAAESCSHLEGGDEDAGGDREGGGQDGQHEGGEDVDRQRDEYVVSVLQTEITLVLSLRSATVDITGSRQCFMWSYSSTVISDRFLAQL